MPAHVALRLAPRRLLKQLQGPELNSGTARDPGGPLPNFRMSCHFKCGAFGKVGIVYFAQSLRIVAANERRGWHSGFKFAADDCLHSRLRSADEVIREQRLNQVKSLFVIFSLSG